MAGKPCHQSGLEKLDRQDIGPKLFKDCSKIDLLSGVHDFGVKHPDLGKVFSISWAAAVTDYSFIPVNSNLIRGPPPGWPSDSQTRPSIILSTLRIRE